MRNDCFIPDWPAPAHVRALQTTRRGGVSLAPYSSLNLGQHVGDAPLAVARNRHSLNTLLPSEPVWLEQVHGTAVADADWASCRTVADACIARRGSSVCVVMTADCLPVLLCDKAGSVVGAVHAGWKGLAAGVIEAAVSAMGVPPSTMLAWLGPAISQAAFEVGAEVRAEFVAADPEATAAFTPVPAQGSGEGSKYLADLYALARLRLRALGITEIYGGDRCTYSEPEQFFSYRRDGITGRQGTFIWLE
ncbi:MAG: peptidoglycan editing factor PgeF [Gallionellales bacterium CG03_land_8_20_14_0_80_55_15]|nr:MAG: peptidoglycan editing factor PgeF [Gallionellales bacterium CG03_land_8_20_14_0_80_55_15]